jgi:hypothetical protein
MSARKPATYDSSKPPFNALDGSSAAATFEGVRDDEAKGAPYFRTRPRFETADTKYAFLNRLLAVGAGEMSAAGPVHVIEEIL